MRRKLSVCFIDDKFHEIASVVDTLKASGLFEIKTYSSYEEFSGEEEPHGVDLFVLDIEVNSSDREFFQFTRRLRDNRTPFVAFSIHHTSARFTSIPGDVSIQSTVFEHGGLDLIAKTPKPGGGSSPLYRREFRNELLRVIMAFYWANA